MDKASPDEEIAFPALLRAARGVYGAAVRVALSRAGYDDVPKNGIFVLGAIARTGAPMAGIIRHLGVSKQAAGQLVDTLVVRGYLERAVDADDRRRLTLVLAERGRGAAQVARHAIDCINADLARQVGPQKLAHAREALMALLEMEHEH